MPRQKHVYDTGEVPHLWFHKTQDSARNAQRNLYFDGDTIYSYGSHFPIARHISHGRKSAVLFTTRSYSPTTAGHISAVRSAIPSGVPIFHLSDVRDTPGQSTIENFACRVSIIAQSSAAFRSESKRQYANEEAETLKAECRALARMYGLSVPRFARLPHVDTEKMKAQRESAQRRADTTSANRRARREARDAEYKAQREAEATQRAIPIETRMASFAAGNTITYTRDFPYPVLCVKGSELVTSLGARVPLVDVAHFFTLYNTVRATPGGSWHAADSEPFSLGVYHLDEIDAEGNVRAGCHNIPAAEVARFASIISASIKL